MYAAIYLLKKLIPGGFVGLCLLTGSGILIYIGVLLIMKDDMIIDFIKQHILSRISRRKSAS